ncbi:uncharacterized protein KQ657_001319 [Scheffersomyces spartinae]|uniref:Zn(2)-C6 fungal-type domain-containing protein n=1 Tax=Scheffersomyces spartinae TaxID=45513 RepID=A0A9P7V7Y2_9ASCO|nr:uncharacterized protein KQ657_001319 [Scheffersomyces spartinae]KAG7192862.1 hypothetical protein KQ657_001319 [Scheffersomyces spartinae]
MTAEKKRKRVPLSCLNCYRRKVKCDRVRPSCGGCVRNGVGHLCEFLEPEWVNDEGEASNPRRKLTTVASLQQPSGSDKVKLEKVIHGQRLEIEELKRQLSVMEQLSRLVAYQKSAINLPLTVLQKLNPLMTAKKDTLHVCNDLTRSIRSASLPPASLLTASSSFANESFVDIYSWINIIRLDPNMTTLWFKITNMQKIYTMYKVRHHDDKLKHTHDDRDRKCPVIECDFNFLADDRPNTPRQETGSANQGRSPQQSQDLGPNDSQSVHVVAHNRASDKGKVTLKKLQSLWDTILSQLPGNERRLKYNQMKFLIDFYFRVHDVKSRKLFVFYKSEIENVIRKNGDNIMINMSFGLSEPKLATDEELFTRINIKGIYLCMLGLIVEETLSFLRWKSEKDFSGGDTIKTFKGLFPNLLQSPPDCKILKAVQSFLVNVSELTESTQEKLLPSLPVITVTIALINREIVHYQTNNIFVILKRLLNAILDPLNPIALWKDPELIVVDEGASKKQIRDIRLHISYLWLEFIRIINLTSFNIVNLTNGMDQLNGYFEQLFTKIEEASFKDYHRTFINNFQQPGMQNYKIQLGCHYLMNKIYGRFKYGINCLQGPPLQLSDMEVLKDESENILKDEQYMTTLDSVYLFEIRLLLLYKAFMIRFLIFLQHEENGNTRAMNSSIVDCFKSYNIIIDFIQLTINEEVNDGQYLLHFINEMLTRLIQFIIGLIIRIDSQDGVITDATLDLIIPRTTTIKGNDSKTSITEYYLNYVTDIVQLLNTSALVNKERAEKLAKLWDFYTTFVKNSKKLKVNYAQIHKAIQFETEAVKGNKAAIQCPVAGSVPDGPPPPDKCPIDPKTWMKANLSKRKCPFDHNSYDVQQKKPSINHIESNIRGRTEPEVAIPDPTLPPESALDYGIDSQTGSEYVVDWNELNEFDFEFMKTEFANDQFDFLQPDI